MRIIDIKDPPLLALITHPELYEGCIVRVGGYMTYDYPYGRLFASRDDRMALGAFFGTVCVSFRGSHVRVDYDALRTNTSRGFIVVQGRFSSTGSCGALIDELESYHFVVTEPSGAVR
jgi:hypothetical protein